SPRGPGGLPRGGARRRRRNRAALRCAHRARSRSWDAAAPGPAQAARRAGQPRRQDVGSRETPCETRCRMVARRIATTFAAAAMLAAAPIAAAQVLTSQYDNARSSATLVETRLTPQTVTAERFGKVATLNVDGDVYAQPL